MIVLHLHCLNSPEDPSTTSPALEGDLRTGSSLLGVSPTRRDVSEGLEDSLGLGWRGTHVCIEGYWAGGKEWSLSAVADAKLAHIHYFVNEKSRCWWGKMSMVRSCRKNDQLEGDKRWMHCCGWVAREVVSTKTRLEHGSGDGPRGVTWLGLRSGEGTVGSIG